MKDFLKRLLIPIALCLSVSGCLTIGPKVKDRITFVHTTTKFGRTVEICKILDSGNVKIIFRTKDGEHIKDKKDLKDWRAVRPDVAVGQGLVAPRILENKIFSIKTEKNVYLDMDLGGWYVVPPGETKYAITPK